MKKERTASRQSEEKGGSGEKKAEAEKSHGVKILVPLLSKREAEPAFVEAIAGKGHEITLLLVIDTNAMAGRFGFATSEIGMGNALMQRLKAELGKKRKACNDVMEWGDTASKIEHIAQFYGIGRIYVVKQGNDYFRKLLADMKEKLKGIEIVEIALPELK